MPKEESYAEPRDRDTEPKKVGNIILLGASHTKPFSETDPSSARFMEVLHGAEHLLMEGERSHQQFSHALGSLEFVAAQTFHDRGKESDIYFLEEGLDLPLLAQQYGLPIRDFLALDSYRLVNTLFDRLVPDNNPEGLAAAKATVRKAHLDATREEYASYRSLPEAEMEAIVDRAIATDLDLRQKGDELTRLKLGLAARQRILFTKDVRDAEVFYPRIRERDQNLDGEKAVVVGTEHVDPLQRALQQGFMGAPKNWSQYVNGLGKQGRDYFRTFENVFGVSPVVKPWFRRLR